MRHRKYSVQICIIRPDCWVADYYAQQVEKCITEGQIPVKGLTKGDALSVLHRIAQEVEQSGCKIDQWDAEQTGFVLNGIEVKVEEKTRRM